MNLLIINKYIPNLVQFMNSINENTQYIIHNNTQTCEYINDQIDNMNIKTFNNVGFVFDNTNGIPKKFLENEYFITVDINNNIISNKSTNFISNLINKYNVNTIDFISCKLLLDQNWISYMNYIKLLHDIQIRSSEDNIGNITNWVLGSDSIKELYFNNNINEWNYTLSTITSTIGGGDWNSTSTWIGGIVPINGDAVIINGPVTVSSTISTTITDITINSGGTITIGDGTINGSILSSISIILAGGILNFNINTDTIFSNLISMTLTSTISNINTGIITCTNTSSTLNESLSKTGTGTIILNSDYIGDTFDINSGQINLNGTYNGNTINVNSGGTILLIGSISSNGDIYINTGGIAQFGNNTLAVIPGLAFWYHLAGGILIFNYSSSLSLSTGNQILLESSLSTLSNINNNVDITCNIGVTTNSLIKTGNGKIIFNGNVGFTGTTTINAGIVEINGIYKSNVTVNNGGTLKGIGKIQASVIINGSINAGNSPGILTITNLTLNNDSVTIFEIDTTTIQIYDVLNITNNLSISKGAILHIVITNTLTSPSSFNFMSYTNTLTTNILQLKQVTSPYVPWTFTQYYNTNTKKYIILYDRLLTLCYNDYVW